MRTIYKLSTFIISAIICCLVSSCTDDDIIGSNKIVEGKPTQVSLTFNVNTSEKIESRAAQSTYYEYLVQNIYIFIFNGDKRVALTQNYFEPIASTNYPEVITNYMNKEDANKNTQSSGTINFGAVSGSNMKICAIANIGTSNSQIDIATLDEINLYSELSQLAVSLNQETVSRGASFLMTGEETVSLEAEKKTEITIMLKRTDSKITFNVNAASENESITDMQFIPGKWRVVNVPTKTWVLPRTLTLGETLTEDKDATAKTDFFSIAGDNMPQFEGAVGNNENSGTFTFYMYENLKKPTDEITDDIIPGYTDTYEGNLKYALREKQDKITPEEDATLVPNQRFINGNYVYAPQYGTYVVFTGELTYTDKSDEDNPKYVIADVEYCVHLGHSGTNNVNDYSTLRNHHYTYNITITGVNSLIVEVDSNDGTNDQEERPGAEGDVVISSAQIINVDAHYDRAIFSLSEEEAKTIYFSVSTPWERGLDANGFASSGTLKDYKWVKFLINKEAEVTEQGFYAPYPGEQCYDGGKHETGTGGTSTAYGSDKTITLRDVRQLSKFLSNENNRNAVKNTDGKIYITAFIDEYLYFYNPLQDPLGSSTTYQGVTQGTNETSLAYWKNSVNQNDRMLHIVKAGDMKYSADGETSVSRSVVTFKQRPILTFYNVGADGLTSAWGTETINETPRMTVTRTNYPTNNNNDYAYSQILTSGSGKNEWSKVISSSEQYGLGTDDYNDPSYACALRNRDLDGDGIIDNNEVQWYLATIDQMSDLYVGEPAMPPYVHLYNEDNPDGTYSLGNNTYYATHYTTSSILSNSPKVYWAEEYGATSTYANSTGWGQSPQADGKHVVSLRCLRNLGMAYNSTDLPQDYISIKNGTPNISSNADRFNETDNEYHVCIDFLNPIAIRETFDNGQPLPYIELGILGSQDNSPYTEGFYVRKDFVETTWHNAYTNEIAMSSICPDGYRMPNQREMIIMTKYLDGWNYVKNYGAYTMFNGQVITTLRGDEEYGTFYYYTGGSNPHRIGRTKSNSYENAGSGGCAVRCVKDYVKPTE